MTPLPQLGPSGVGNPAYGLRPLLALLLGGVLLLGGGCGREERPPRTGIPDTLLIRALIDTHVAGVVAARNDLDADSLRAAALAPLGLDTAAFARALDAYAERPEALLRLYDRAIAQMLVEQAAIDPTVPPPSPPE